MLTSAQGWALGSTPDGNVASILVTNDGGTHWENVSPSGISSSPYSSAFFLDESNAWLAVPSADGATVTIYKTQDGGQSWQSGVPIALSNGGPGSLDFIDPQNGWFLTNLGAAAGSESVEIFKTSDGGLNWETVSLTSGDATQSTNGSLPFTCEKTGIAFVNNSVGWAAGSCASGPLFFYKTNNAGETWQAQTLPTPPGYPQNIFADCHCSVTPPEFVSSQSGTFKVSVFDKHPGAILYVTNDGGATWNSYPLPTTNPLTRPDFVDGSTGFLTDGKVLYVTQDGGQSWKTIAKFPTSVVQSGLDFINGKDGWFTSGEILYVSHDGGQSWSRVEPVAALIPLPETTQPLQLPQSNTAVTFTANLALGISQGYVLHIQSPQSIYLMKNGSARIEVLDSQNQPILKSTSKPGPLKVDIPKSGDYTIVLDGENIVDVSVYLPSQASSSQESLPLPSSFQIIDFYPGTNNASISVNLPQDSPVGYSLKLEQGQQVNITAQGDVTLAVLDENDKLVPLISPSRGQWQLTIQQTGVYRLVLLGSGPTTFTIYLPALTPKQTSTSLLPATRTRITFPSGETSTTITTTLTTSSPQGYVLRVQQNQRIYIVASSDTITLTLLDPENQPLGVDHAAESDLWSAGIPDTGDYTLVVDGQGSVSLKVYIPKLEKQTPTPVSPPANSTPINFPTGNASTTFSTVLSEGQPQGYRLKLHKGQQLYITATGNVSVGVIGPGNTPLPVEHPIQSEVWSATIAQDGDYTIVISGNGGTTVTIFSPPLAASPHQTVPTPKKVTRITIPKGDSSIAFVTTLESNQPQGYVVRVFKGEQLNVSATGGANVGFLGPDGSVLKADHAQNSDQWSVVAPTSDDYTAVLSGNGSSTVTISEVSSKP